MLHEYIGVFQVLFKHVFVCVEQEDTLFKHFYLLLQQRLLKFKITNLCALRALQIGNIS